MADEPSSLVDPAGQLTVFISWSLPLSRRVAEILHPWLKRLMQNVRPWMSNQDIEKGKFWVNEVVSGIEGSTVGIAVITPANVDRPWINFEAGALARAIEPANGLVIPLLINMGNTLIQHSPLNTLQAARFEKGDFYRVVEAINSRLRPRPIDAEILREEFEEKWPKLEQAVGIAIKVEEEREESNIAPAARPVPDVLEDVLTAMRNVRNDIRRMQVEGIQQRDDWRKQKWLEILTEIAAILDAEAVHMNPGDVEVGRALGINLHLHVDPSDPEDRVERARKKLEAIPKYKVVWSPSPHIVGESPHKSDEKYDFNIHGL